MLEEGRRWFRDVVVVVVDFVVVVVEEGERRLT